VASALTQLSQAVNTGAVATPVRRKSAIKLVGDDAAYSPHERAKIMVLFAKDISVADTYADISDKEDRVNFIQEMLSN
jgi:hypothetical protein